MFFREESTPRWIIFSTDVLISILALTLAYLLRFNFEIPESEKLNFRHSFPIAIIIRALGFYIFKTYAGILRYTSTHDGQRILYVTFFGSIAFGISNFASYLYSTTFFFPISVIIIEFLASIFMLISLRLAVKVLYFQLKSPTKERANVVIFGAGDSGIITKRTLDRDRGMSYNVVAFVDDNVKKISKKVEGIDIYSSDKLEEILQKYKVTQLIIAVQNLDRDRKKLLVEMCLQYSTKVRTVPPVFNWINGELSFNQIKHIKIEDLLGRDQIQLNKDQIKKELSFKTVLITGASGSIGSELVRQIAPFNPKRIVLVDQAESPMYDIECELNESNSLNECEIIIADIRNYERLETIFWTYKPEIVFHAAAYKHVPLMENNPFESVRTNIMGTKNIADLSAKNNVKKFVMISTDKAVNPTNVMGATKRIAEIYIQSLNAVSETKFITTRFGNVLGSNGSVIPLFKKQIEKGGPITVTHPEVTRFFMTIPEACQLVLEAGTMGNGGEIFIFDMGSSIKILDLAKKMVKLSGLELGKDIEIRFTGLRPGEKLYEELLNDKESTLPTHHKQIMKAEVREYAFDTISREIDDLITLTNSQDNNEIVRKMKLIVPEYKSQNSVFSVLDEAI